MSIKELKESYFNKKDLIEERLSEFRNPKTDKEILSELTFCLLTPQSKAKSCWQSIESIKEKNLFFAGAEALKPHLNCRFSNNKAGYLELAVNRFDEIKNHLGNDNRVELREWIVKNIKGFGYKEASHFLRNIGIDDFAILDRHILKNLKKYSVIEEVPKTLTPKKYKEIEEKMRRFSCSVGIPLSHLDLLFWSQETGEIFK